ncbi:PepSY-associated TM helix domain-containing protein [Blastomonas sp.]|uniref:PepSY-associated TM helix domain-containing protein n=1 Tax=Blastomonas TaxID=150203 RepID=UPI00258871DE|nr:PepSY-associated TM helix domain-containing protein [Blastomonas sp.]
MSAVASDTPRTVHGDEAKAGRRKAVPLSYWLHSLVGLKLSLFLGFVCLTGTIATVAHEIEWLYKPAVRASAMQREADWGAMWDAAKAAHPYATLTAIGSYERNDAPYFAKSVSATDGTGQEFTIYVDPGTSRVTGHEYGRSFQDAMRALHYYLFAPGPIPMYIVTSLGFLLVLSLVTGLISYKKFWRGFWRMPRWHRDLRTVMGDLHRLIGLWSVWFVAVIGVTSIWYFVEHAGLDLNAPPPFVKPIQPGPTSRATRSAAGPGSPGAKCPALRSRRSICLMDPATPLSSRANGRPGWYASVPMPSLSTPRPTRWLASASRTKWAWANASSTRPTRCISAPLVASPPSLSGWCSVSRL